MPGIEELTRMLDNFYTAIFERAERSQNRRLGRAIINSETDPADDPTGDSQPEGNDFQPHTARAYAPLTIAGADQDADNEIFKIQTSTGRVQYGSACLDETSLTIVFRLRPDFNSSGSGNHWLFSWRDDANNRLYAYWQGSTEQWVCVRRATTLASHTESDSFSSGAKRTIAFRWASGTLGVSIDGGAFQTTAGTSIPALTATQFDLLSADGTANWADMGLLWAFAYLGEMTDAEIAALDAIGDVDPTARFFFGLSTAAVQDLAPDGSFIWGCDGATAAAVAEHHSLSYAGECNV
jgi:hypothetical protein